MIDRLLPNDGEPHRYDAIFHALADDHAVNVQTGAFVGTSDGEAGLVIQPLGNENMSVEVISGQKEPVFQGWVPGGGKYSVVPVPTPIFTTKAKGPVTMAWIIQPLRPGQSSPIRRCVTRAVENGEVSDITFADGTNYRLLLRHEGDAPVRAGETTSTASITLMEQRADGSHGDLIVIE